MIGGKHMTVGKGTALSGKALWGFVFASAVAGFITLSCSGPSEKYDLLITNTRIVDGTGKPSYVGNLAVTAERIVAVGKTGGDAAVVIDGTGLVTSPGFIDAHTHADNNILKYPLAENFIMQGVTTLVTGNCGGSPAPRRDKSFADYLSEVEKTGITPNLAQLVGHVEVRMHVMGDDFKREATPEEVQRMNALVEESMQSGAFGISTFLDPSAGEYASMEKELLPLAKTVGRYGGGLWPHHRHHRSHWATADPVELGYGLFHGPEEDAFVGTYRGLLEVIDVCRKAQIHLHVAHLVNVYRMPQPHPAFLDEAAARATLSIIDDAIREGINVTFDVTYALAGVARRNYLINEFWRGRNVALDWLNGLSRDEAVEKLKTAEVRERIRRIAAQGRLKLGMINTKADPYWMDRFMILKCSNQGYAGKIVSEIASSKGLDALDTLFEILAEDPETLWVQHRDERYFEAAVPVLLKHPNASPNTDWACAPPITNPEGEMEGEDMWYTSSPIGYGLFADYIGTLVREKEIFTLEEAVNRATWVPARKVLGLSDRGALEPGAYADIVVFDLDEIAMAGDYLQPAQRPAGIKHVIVNGERVYQDNAHGGGKPGKVLRHRPQGLSE